MGRCFELVRADLITIVYSNPSYKCIKQVTAQLRKKEEFRKRGLSDCLMTYTYHGFGR